MDEKMNELIPVAMDIIMHAGDARLENRKALQSVKSMQFDEASEHMGKAREEITLAHRAQTIIIQSEASGICYEYSMLFNHAQDTLMCVNSEIELTQEFIDIFHQFKKMIMMGENRE